MNARQKRNIKRYHTKAMYRMAHSVRPLEHKTIGRTPNERQIIGYETVTERIGAFGSITLTETKQVPIIKTVKASPYYSVRLDKKI
jgi:hypothetical protein